MDRSGKLRRLQEIRRCDQATPFSTTSIGGPASAPARRTCRLSLGCLYQAAVDYFLNFEQQPDDVDTKIGLADYVSITTRGQFSPSTVIDDARQRWLFRMVHTRRPLQEKMALFWHNHFGIGYSKVAGVVGAIVRHQDDGEQAG